MARYIVSKVGDIEAGSQELVKIKGREIVVFNVDGEYFALLNRCPHEGASLMCGARFGLLQSDQPGQFTYTRCGEFIRCPWHGWEYDIRTGQSWCDPKDNKIKSYITHIADGETLVKGPYVAESFPVFVEENYVVIEV